MPQRVYFAATHRTSGVATTSDAAQPNTGWQPAARSESIGDQNIAAIVINLDQVPTTGELTALLAKLTSIVRSDTKLRQLFGAN